mmetsp:Transcript_36547/g.103213  ORF Transcript_36547/g.103213 Transcript_36547/m.103213 type:complete len:224 (-) Transcript_36547:49-720(-)
MTATAEAEALTVFVDTNLSTSLVISVSEGGKAQNILDETAKMHKSLFPLIGKVKGERLLLTKAATAHSDAGTQQYAVPLKYPLKGLLANTSSVMVHLRPVDGPVTTGEDDGPAAETTAAPGDTPVVKRDLPVVKTKSAKKAEGAAKTTKGKGKQAQEGGSDAAKEGATAAITSAPSAAATAPKSTAKRMGMFAHALAQYKEAQVGDSKKPSSKKSKTKQENAD